MQLLILNLLLTWIDFVLVPRRRNIQCLSTDLYHNIWYMFSRRLLQLFMEIGGSSLAESGLHNVGLTSINSLIGGRYWVTLGSHWLLIATVVSRMSLPVLHVTIVKWRVIRSIKHRRNLRFSFARKPTLKPFLTFKFLAQFIPLLSNFIHPFDLMDPILLLLDCFLFNVLPVIISNISLILPYLYLPLLLRILDLQPFPPLLHIPTLLVLLPGPLDVLLLIFHSSFELGVFERIWLKFYLGILSFTWLLCWAKPFLKRLIRCYSIEINPTQKPALAIFLLFPFQKLLIRLPFPLFILLLFFLVKLLSLNRFYQKLLIGFPQPLLIFLIGISFPGCQLFFSY